ncbi:ABC transporter permease [Balneolales bacterium ANBcel1]|nr:ABC transporter permease [Balneolales bacterium ANBcel1]
MLSTEKLLLIIQREYLVRLKSKVFIVTTILAPVFMILLLVIPSLVHVLTSDTERRFQVYDETGVIAQRMIATDSVFYQPANASTEELRQRLQVGSIEGYILIPHEVLDGRGQPAFYHDGSAGMTTTSRIRSDIREFVRQERLDRLEASDEIRAVLSERISVNNYTITETGEEAADTGASAAIGFIMGFIIYGAMLGYGTVIMRSVMEEKSSRVVEVIASSVRPFELLLGKVTGVALLGLTQFLIWAFSGALLMMAAGPVLALFTGADAATAEAAGEAAAFTLPTISPMVWVGFVLFFLLGYLVYSALFAAVGSAIEQESDSQQLQIPIIMLIVVPLIFLMTVSENPNSTLAIALSMFPFFAPILMPVRMAVVSVPLWQFAGTMAIMILTFLVLIWMSSRIYRIGILMYGKKASFRELVKWVRQA